MNLADYQRTLVRLSFAREASEADFAEFADRARFVMYRQMIRSRLLGMARQAFQATMEVVGNQAFELAFERYLAASPPRSPLIRDAIADFGPFASQDSQLLSEAPAFAADLVRFEEAKWRVAYRKRVLGEGAPREFDFSGVPVFNAALEQLSLAHRVHELEGGCCRAEPCQLLVYRPPQHDDLRWYVPDPLFSQVLSCARTQPATSLAELVRNASQLLGKALDEVLLEELASGVTLALQRGVLLGSR
jgi:hypothetical protein